MLTHVNSRVTQDVKIKNVYKPLVKKRIEHENKHKRKKQQNEECMEKINLLLRY